MKKFNFHFKILILLNIVLIMIITFPTILVVHGETDGPLINEEQITTQMLIGEITGQTVSVSNESEFLAALYQPEVEVIEFLDDITIGSGGTYNVRSNSRQKIIDGNGYTLIANNNGHLYNHSSEIDRLFIRNVSNMYSYNANNTQGFIRFYSNPAELHLENVGFNTENNPNAGILGASYESVVHFYGNNTLNFLKGTSGLRFRKIHLHEHAQVNMMASNGSALQILNTLRASNVSTGIQVDDYAHLTIKANNRVVDHTFANDDFELLVGKNAVVSLESTTSDAVFVSRAGSYVQIGEGSTVNVTSAGTAFNLSKNRYHPIQFDIQGKLNIYGNQGLNFGTSEANFMVQPNGELIVEVNSFPMHITGLLNVNPRTIQVMEKGRLVLKQTEINNALIQTNIPIHFVFNQPKEVDFINGNTRLFNPGPTHHFTVTNSILQSWEINNSGDEPTAETDFLESAQFSMQTSNTIINEINPPQENFETDFSPMNRRLRVEAKIDPPKIETPIFDTNLEIKGQAQPKDVIELLNQNGEIIQTTETNEEGNFLFKLEQPFVVETKLGFRSKKGNITSEIVETTVLGNRLEFAALPEDISFEATQIKNEPDLLINRKNTDFSINIIDTRQDGDWKLTVEAITPLTAASGDTIRQALFYQDDKTDSLLSIENQSQMVATKKQSLTENYIDKVTWDKNEGIVIKTNPIYATNDKYKSILEWTLVDAP
jgi:hypothetical protein